MRVTLTRLLGLGILAATPLWASSPRPLVHGPGTGEDGVDVTVTPSHAKAVTRGLAWLAAHQNEDGSWPGRIGYKLNYDYDYDADAWDSGVGHVGVTALACIAYLAGGHLPGRGKYGDVVERGLGFVLSCSQGDGYITHGGTRMYSHAFATLFLAEIYGMTHRGDVRAKLQKAVDLIVDCQNEEGGWRYEPFTAQSDMSIVVCQVLALRAARNIGIKVPRSTVDDAIRYVVDSAITEDSRGFSRGRYGMVSRRGSFNYQKGIPSRSSFALTAAGVTALQGLGVYRDEAIEDGLRFLEQNLLEFNRDFGGKRKGHYFFWYGHYYGVQAMYQTTSTLGTSHWEGYFTRIREEILDLQLADGSFPNQTGPGPAFGTAMAVLILEIPYRFLPIFQR